MSDMYEGKNIMPLEAVDGMILHGRTFFLMRNSHAYPPSALSPPDPQILHAAAFTLPHQP